MEKNPYLLNVAQKLVKTKNTTAQQLSLNKNTLDITLSC